MTYPTFRDLLARQSRRLLDPDFGILNESIHNASGHAQIFRATASDAASAVNAIYPMADKAIALGVGGIHGVGSAQYRSMDGAVAIERRLGRLVPAYLWRLAILRPLQVSFHPAYVPTLEDEAKAAEMGLEVGMSPECWEAMVEFGLDVEPNEEKP